MSEIRLGSAVLVRDGDCILLGCRSKEPNRGKWIIPGGKIEPFESVAQAGEREVLEETGLLVEVGSQIGVFEIIQPPDEHRVIVYSWATLRGGSLHAASDLSDVRFVDRSEAALLNVSPIVREVLVSVDWLERL